MDINRAYDSNEINPHSRKDCHADDRINKSKMAISRTSSDRRMFDIDGCLRIFQKIETFFSRCALSNEITKIDLTSDSPSEVECSMTLVETRPSSRVVTPVQDTLKRKSISSISEVEYLDYATVDTNISVKANLNDKTAEESQHVHTYIGQSFISQKICKVESKGLLNAPIFEPVMKQCDSMDEIDEGPIFEPVMKRCESFDQLNDAPIFEPMKQCESFDQFNEAPILQPMKQEVSTLKTDLPHTIKYASLSSISHQKVAIVTSSD